VYGTKKRSLKAELWAQNATLRMLFLSTLNLTETHRILPKKRITHILFRIPLCTLKNFPYQIEHTIQWARDHFEGALVEDPSEASKYFENPHAYLEKTIKELKNVHLLVDLETCSVEDEA
jgi:hypothetical protein